MDGIGDNTDDRTSLRFAIEAQLVAAGWGVCAFATTDADLSIWWKVVGTNGLRSIEGDGASPEEAWLCALEQARAFDSPGRPRACESAGASSS